MDNHTPKQQIKEKETEIKDYNDSLFLTAC